MPTPSKLAAALAKATTAASDDMVNVAKATAAASDDMVKVQLKAADVRTFEVGGRSGRIVTHSDHPRIFKGYRLLQVDGRDLDGANAAQHE